MPPKERKQSESKGQNKQNKSRKTRKSEEIRRRKIMEGRAEKGQELCFCLSWPATQHYGNGGEASLSVQFLLGKIRGS